MESLGPVAVQALSSPGSGVQAVAAGEDFTCAVVNGGAQCWGKGGSGQLGNGSNPFQSYLPGPVRGLDSGVQAIATGAAHACALVNGGVECWGYNGTFRWKSWRDPATRRPRSSTCRPSPRESLTPAPS